VDLAGAVREGKGGGGELVAGVIARIFEDGEAADLPYRGGAALVAVHGDGGGIEEEEAAFPQRGGHVAKEPAHVYEPADIVEGIVGTHDDVVGAAGLGIEQVPADEADAGDAPGIAASDAEHGQRTVHAADGVPGPGEGEGEDAGAAAEVQHAGGADAARL